MARFVSDGVTRLEGVLEGDAQPYGGPDSYQPVAVDLELTAGAGGTAGDPSFLAPIMGNLLGSTLTKAGNYLAGLIGHFTVDGANSSTYPTGAVLAGIGDGVTDVHGAVVAYIDGDSAQTNAGAMFKVMSNNSTAASGPDYGLDLQDAAHDGFKPVDEAFYKKAPLRLPADVVVLTGAAAPTDGGAGTGQGFAGPGSLYVDTAGAKLYINTNTAASPTWTVVGSQS